MTIDVRRAHARRQTLVKITEVLHAYRVVRRASEVLPFHPPDAEQTPHWTLHYSVSGERRLRVAGRQLIAGPGDLVILRRDTLVNSSSPDGSGSGILHVCFTAGPNWSPPAGFRRHGERLYTAKLHWTSTRQRLLHAFNRMLVHARTRFAITSANAAGTGGVESEIKDELMVLTLREMLLLAEYDLEVDPELDVRVRDTLKMMSTDLTMPHTLESLSRACQISPSRLTQLFRATLGTTPIRTLRRMRLHQAALDLQYTDDSVERIAEATGFSSISHLSHEFRRRYGVSPRGYRADHRPYLHEGSGAPDD